MNNAPEFATSFIWRIVLADEANALEPARAAIARVAGQLDGARQIIFVSGCIGLDFGRQNWDTQWPYCGRPSFRINHDWQYLARFMTDMRDRHNAWISFHVNLTDCVVGLAYDEEYRAFWEELKAAGCIYTRAGTGLCGEPYGGRAYVPREIPLHEAKMPYVTKPGDPIDFFAVVDYKKFWESGLVHKSVKALYDHLPYAPPILYWDVLSCTGNNCCVGYPDGLLGHDMRTQIEGRQRMIEYLRTLGSEPGGEGPVDICRYGWSHGGLAANDYSLINTGYGHGVGAARGAKAMHVYGNQGGYHHQIDYTSADRKGKFGAGEFRVVRSESGGVMLMPAEDAGAEGKLAWPLRVKEVDHHIENGTAQDMVQNFYMTVIQELYHIGKGNVRLPGGAPARRPPAHDPAYRPEMASSFAMEPPRIDEHYGRAELDCLYLVRADLGLDRQYQADEARLEGTCQVFPNRLASNGKVVMGMDLALFNGVTFDIEAPGEGDYQAVLRYRSPLGGVLELEVNGEFIRELELPPTAGADPGRNAYFGDYAFPVRLRAGANTIRLCKGVICAAWSDGTTARWDRNGFYAACGDVVLGIGTDRMWPDTWSGQQKIYFYSLTGCTRTWTLPREWARIRQGRLFRLSAAGRDSGIDLPIVERTVRLALDPGVPAILAAVSG